MSLPRSHSASQYRAHRLHCSGPGAQLCAGPPPWLCSANTSTAVHGSAQQVLRFLPPESLNPYGNMYWGTARGSPHRTCRMQTLQNESQVPSEQGEPQGWRTELRPAPLSTAFRVGFLLMADVTSLLLHNFTRPWPLLCLTCCAKLRSQSCWRMRAAGCWLPELSASSQAVAPHRPGEEVSKEQLLN